MNENEVVPIYAELLSISDYCEQAESTAEAHGILTGLLCRDPFVGTSQWLSVLEFEGEPGDERFQMVRNQLDDLHRFSSQMLNHIDNEFNPVIPDDDEPLAFRIRELAAWCQGFLYGFSNYVASETTEYIETYEYGDDDDLDLDDIRKRAANAAQLELESNPVEKEEAEETEFPDSVEEILEDITHLSRADDADLEGRDVTESDETAFMEVLEYLRVSVQLVFEEMAGQNLEGRQDPIEVDPRFTFSSDGDDESVH